MGKNALSVFFNVASLFAKTKDNLKVDNISEQEDNWIFGIGHFQ